MTKFAVVSVSFETSLLTSVRKTPLGPAGCERLTGKLACCPGDTVTFAGNRMSGPWTVTFALALETFAGPVACIAVLPIATPVTGTVTELDKAGIVTEAGTVAVAGASELRVTSIETGVAPDKFSVMFCTEPATTVRDAGAKLSEAVTVTVPAPGL
jgi:hypothetical protein